MVCSPNNIFRDSLVAGFLWLTILPAIFLFTANARIAKTLAKRRSLWISTNYETSNGSRSSQISSSSPRTNKQNCPLYESQRDAMRNEQTLTMRLFIVSVTFFILSTPSLVVVGFEAFMVNSANTKLYKQAFDDAFHISLFLFAINLTINFILYCLVGRTFRSAVFALICCDWANYKALRFQLIKGSSEHETANAPLPSRQQSTSNAISSLETDEE